MLPTIAVGILALFLSILLYSSAVDAPNKISPQGCRMSWMSPSYILQPDFNASWTPLARRYSLWLYREVGWDNSQEPNGVPVLFIPGNAGSSRQVRSIASSASRQYYASPSAISPQFSSRGMKPLDFFAVELNEDLSAFHGPTLESQKIYTAQAIRYILSLYPPKTSIIVLGHSMGGIVATSLLPSPHISTIITMSSPHTVPPARFDSRIDAIYKAAQEQVAHDETPILSICGGITDMMIPSEFCTIPQSDAPVFRKTVFTSALEGCWSGVGHQEMVWCHQVRSRVARAALELGLATNPQEKSKVLEEWFRDGIDANTLAHEFPSWPSQNRDHDFLPEGRRLVLHGPLGSRAYSLPVPRSGTARFVLYLSKGAIAAVSPANALALTVSTYICRRERSLATSDILPHCQPLTPTQLRLIPNPVAGMPFPVPNEGVDESDGVVAFTAILPQVPSEEEEVWVAVKVEGGDGNGWVIAGFESETGVLNDAATLAPLFGPVSVTLNSSALHAEVEFPNFISNALLVYRISSTLSQSCQGPLLSPLLLHTSSPSEAHYHRVAGDLPILLHSHSSAPFLRISPIHRDAYTRGLNLTVYSSGECGATTLTVEVDWWSSLGRWGPRYWNAVLSWGSAVVGIMFFSSWSAWDSGAQMRTVGHSLRIYTRKTLPKLTLLFVAISLIPWPESIWLGNRGELAFVFLAPLILLLSSGFVSITWLILVLLMWPLSKISGRRQEDAIFIRRDLISILFISVLVFLVVPWQVAFLGCYLIHFYNCASDVAPATIDQHDAHNQKMHILLLMTWCLPVVAPVLVVWVRTMATAGLTTPFDGDHFVINVIGFMVLTCYITCGHGQLFSRRHQLEIVPLYFWYALGAAVSFLTGARSTYRMYESFNWPTITLVVFRLGPRLWEERHKLSRWKDGDRQM